MALFFHNTIFVEEPLIIMNPQVQDISSLFQHAISYHRKGDVYSAVKVLKKLIKLVPDWSPPYQRLSAIYKYQNDWKAAFYYGQRAIETDPGEKSAWRNFAIAATALKKWQIARTAWNKVGFQFKEVKKAPNFEMGVIPVRLKYDHFSEIIWATRIDPARALIQSIPDPASDRNYGDVILIDYKHIAYRIIEGKRLPVYDELQILKRSHFQTYLVFLFEATKTDIDQLDHLCYNTNIGFDNWSRLTEQQCHKYLKVLPEYYNEGLPIDLEAGVVGIALAAEKIATVREVMQSWSVISLKNYHIFRLR